MSATATKPECYGAMFPDLSKLTVNTVCKGKAFTVQVNSIGIGVQSREIHMDEQGWKDCIECPHYHSCYDLSMAKLALWHALRAES
jgi:hypothetical protein